MIGIKKPLGVFLSSLLILIDPNVSNYLCSGHHGICSLCALSAAALLLQHLCEGQWTQHPLQTLCLQSFLDRHSVALPLSGQWPQRAGLQPLHQRPQRQREGDHAGPERQAGQLPGQGAVTGEIQC